MHLIKENNNILIYNEIELLVPSSIKQMQEYKSIQSSNDGINPNIKMRYKYQ